MIIIFGKLLYSDDISRQFFSFYLILTFWDVREVKGQKIAQNKKQLLHPLHAISQEQYSISSHSLQRDTKSDLKKHSPT